MTPMKTKLACLICAPGSAAAILADSRPGTAGFRSPRSPIAWPLSSVRSDFAPPGISWCSPSLLLSPAIWAAGSHGGRSGKIKDPQIRGGGRSTRAVDHAGRRRYAQLEDATWLAFALFRLFDIWKPPPVRQLEALPGGLGYQPGRRDGRRLWRTCVISGAWMAVQSLLNMPLRKSSDARPQISQVTPPAAIAGGELQIRGKGFAPGGTAARDDRRSRRAGGHRLGFAS